MTSPKAPLWLRPVHQWFFFWEARIATIYRVVAVGVAAGITTAAMALLFGVPWYLAAVAATAGWIALAVAQEHDERVTLPVDAEFERLLGSELGPLLAEHGYTFWGSSGPCRARTGREDTFHFIDQDPDEPDIWIRRDRSHPVMEVAFRDTNLIRRSETGAGDVAALTQSFERIFGD